MDKLHSSFYKFQGKFGTMEIPASQIHKINSTAHNEVGITLALYQIDLEDMIQTNMYTGFRRKVVKQGGPPPKNLLDDIPVSTVHHSLSIIQIQCHTTDASKTEESMKETLHQSLKQHKSVRGTIEIDSRQMSHEELRRQCDEYAMDLTIVRSVGEILTVELTAYSNKDIEIVKHKCEIKKLTLDKVQSFEYPSTWTNGK